MVDAKGSIDEMGVIGKDTDTNTNTGDGEGTVISIDLPEGYDPEEIAKEVIARGASLVVDKTVPKPKNMADLLRMEKEGWPSVLAMPSPAGPVSFPLIIVATMEIHDKIRVIGEQYHTKSVDLLNELSVVKSELETIQLEMEELKEAGKGDDGKYINEDTILSKLELARAKSESVVDIYGKQPAIQDDYYGGLYDTGVVGGWSTEEIGLECNRENFVALCRRANGALALGIRTRFNDLIKPKLEVLDGEGKAS